MILTDNPAAGLSVTPIGNDSGLLRVTRPSARQSDRVHSFIVEKAPRVARRSGRYELSVRLAPGGAEVARIPVLVESE